MISNLVGSTYGRFCIKFPQNRMKGERHRPTEPLVICLYFVLFCVYVLILKIRVYNLNIDGWV
jgi:hypothetical protein